MDGTDDVRKENLRGRWKLQSLKPSKEIFGTQGGHFKTVMIKLIKKKSDAIRYLKILRGLIAGHFSIRALSGV